jgi:hypothetical protein
MEKSTWFLKETEESVPPSFLPTSSTLPQSKKSLWMQLLHEGHLFSGLLEDIPAVPPGAALSICAGLVLSSPSAVCFSLVLSDYWEQPHHFSIRQMSLVNSFGKAN